MKPTLVTGANGHVGNNLCRLLLARGERVRAMVRASADPAALAGLDVEVVHGDVRDAEATARAVAGCGRVYHTAAGFLMWSRDPERDIVAASVEGTRNVVGAAARAGVEKVLYVSTGGTIGFTDSPDVILDETYHTATPHTHYFRGKVAAEKEAFAIGAREILPSVSMIIDVGPSAESFEAIKPLLRFGVRRPLLLRRSASSSTTGRGSSASAASVV